MLNLLSLWRSTRALDDRKVGGAERSQSVVHALLSAKDQVPQETPPSFLRGKIAMRLEDTRPLALSAGDAWLAGAARGGLIAVLLLSMAGVVIWTTNGFGSRGAAAPSEVAKGYDNDDPDPDVMNQGQSGPVVVARAMPLVETRRERTSVPLGERPTVEQRQAERDMEKLASTLMQSLPVRQNDPR